MPQSASSRRANCGARSIALSFHRRRNAGEAAFELIGGRPGEAQAEIAIGHLEPVAGADISAMLLQQRSEEHTSELQSLMRISYAVFCLKKKNKTIALCRHTKSPTNTKWTTQSMTIPRMNIQSDKRSSHANN